MDTSEQASTLDKVDIPNPDEPLISRIQTTPDITLASPIPPVTQEYVDGMAEMLGVATIPELYNQPIGKGEVNRRLLAGVRPVRAYDWGDLTLVYLRGMGDRHRPEQREIEERLATLSREIERDERRIMDKYRTKHREESRLRLLEVTHPLDLRPGLEDLLRTEEVELDSVDTHCIRVRTKNIEMRRDDRVLPMGRYLLTLIPAEQVVKVTEGNITTLGGYIHPHVNSQGKTCLGDTQHWVDQAWRTFDLKTIVLKHLAVLRTYNAESPYEKWAHFYKQYDPSFTPTDWHWERIPHWISESDWEDSIPGGVNHIDTRTTEDDDNYEHTEYAAPLYKKVWTDTDEDVEEEGTLYYKINSDYTVYTGDTIEEY